MAMSERLLGAIRTETQRVDAVISEAPQFGPYLYELEEARDTTPPPSRGNNEITGETLFLLPTPTKAGAFLSREANLHADQVVEEFLAAALTGNERQAQPVSEVPGEASRPLARRRSLGELTHDFYKRVPSIRRPKALAEKFGSAD